MMSDDSFDDSFESGEGSDHEVEPVREIRVMQTLGPGSSPRPQSMFSGSIPPPSLYSKSLAMRGKDAEFGDDSRFKEERSPKPKKKFGSNFGSTLRKSAIGSIRRPNMANFKQKIKSKLRRDQPVFGAPLEAAIQRSCLGTDGIELPTVFRECISYLEDNGLEHEGLYRLPGVKSKIEDAKSRYDRGEVVDLDDYDPNVVASLLKLYLRELPEALINPITAMRLESITALPREEQGVAIMEEMEDVPVPNKLMLAWLLEHMSHIIKLSNVNKMGLPNLVIVFSPTLQLSAPILHSLYNNAADVFGPVELAKYEKPVVEKKSGRLKLPNLKESEELTTEEEIDAELDKLLIVLDKLHAKMAGKYDEKNDYFWELQRTITDLRRKKKNLQKKNVEDPVATSTCAMLPMAGGEEEFMRTLVLMEATLTAENEVLLAKKEKLQAAIREETKLIEDYKKKLQEQRSRLHQLEGESDEENGFDDENELAKKVAELRWHEKELEMRNKNLVKSIKEEEDEIMQLKVKLKVLPLKQKLNADE